jgi:hypothetical protein
MDQGGALQGMIRPLGLQMVVREPPEFLVDERQDILERLFVTFFPVTQ